VSNAKRRAKKLESSLTPKPAVLLWMQEAHAFNGFKEYFLHLKSQPDNAWPINKLTTHVAAGVRQTLKGKPQEEIDQAVRQAHRDVLFLYYLQQQVNGKVVSEERNHWSQAMLLTSKLGSLLREQSLLEHSRKSLVADEQAGAVSQREFVPDELPVGKTGQSPEQFRQQAEHWKELALLFLPEIHTLRKVIDSINERYFESQGILFSSDAEGLDELLVLVEKTVGIFNESLVVDLERLERLVVDTENRQEESPLTIDLVALVDNVQGAAREQVAYLVDMAKADALDILGETRQALELVDRHV